MNIEANCPPQQAWSEWLQQAGDVAVSEDTLLRHLDGCESCQAMVAKLTADDPFYCQSRDALRSSGLSSHDWQVSDTQSIVQSEHDESSPAIVALVQSLVGPSDDDRSLGRLGRFEVIGVIGSGGMGIVLKARSIDMDRVVAIKIPQPQYWQSPDTLLTLEREARSAASVVHPNVISIYHVDRYRDVPYLVMPYLPGQSLQQRIVHCGPVAIADALRILRQVASALAAAHACGVVHRDVKPANILLGAGTERVVLSDFGLAKIQTDATCTATGTFAGTPIYLSPEQASGCGAGPAGDIYSLGTVLWTMLCGQPPLAGMHTHAIVRRIAESKLPDLTKHRDDVPDWLQRLIAKLHADQPSQRPTAEQVVGWVESCERYLADPKSTELPSDLCGEARKSVSRRVLVLSAMAVVALVMIGWQVFGLRGANDQPQAIGATTQATDDGAAPVETKSIAPPVVAISGTDSQQDESQLFLDQVRSELDEISATRLPEWESQMQTLFGESDQTQP